MSMSAQEVYNQYQKTAVETLSPGKLLLMLYDGAIKNINNAKKAIENKDISQAHVRMIVTQKIIVELMSSLDMDYPISEQLFALYEYMHHRLVDANIKKDANILDEVLKILIELRETWDQAIKSLNKAEYKPCTLKSVNFSG